MPSWVTAARMQALAAAVAALAFGPAAAQAASSPAHAVVTGCQVDSFTVVGAVKMTGRRARAVRGAVLQLRFGAVPLFGIPQLGQWRSVGKKTSGSGQQTFTGLLADQWYGVMSWRFKRGSRTLAGGDARSEPGRVGRIRGGAGCTLAIGLKLPDNTAPTITISPNDQGWHRGPVTIFAKDDFSGVRSVSYSLDGGPLTSLTNGSSFPVSGDGPHSVHAVATDVAGNTATLDTTVRIDQSPPSKPSLSRPFSVTSSTQPTFTWSASSDSASGVQGYALKIVRASDGAVVFFSFYPASTTSVAPATLTDGQTYTATVTAGDNSDPPNTADSDPLTFRVDTHPGITSSNPADGSIANPSPTTITITLDRAADRSTVENRPSNNQSVTLTQVDGSGVTPGVGSVTCDASCTTLTATLNSAPPEGRYTATLNGVNSQEGVAITGTVHFAVPFDTGSSTSSTCVSSGTKTYPLTSNDSSERGRFSFNWSINGSGSTWTAQVFDSDGTTPLGSAINGSGTSGTGQTLEFPLGSKTGPSIVLKFTVACASPTTQMSVSNIVGSRVP